MSRCDPHGVDPSRATQRPNVDAYRAGQLAGRKDKAGPDKLRAANTGGIPPGKSGCRVSIRTSLLVILAAPLACIAAGWWIAGWSG